MQVGLFVCKICKQIILKTRYTVKIKLVHANKIEILHINLRKRFNVLFEQRVRTNDCMPYSTCPVVPALFFLYMIILFKFKVAILKITCNMASLNINCTFKVTDRMILDLT